jgi:hypothetical protein
MAQTIYKLFMFRPTEAWYQLSGEERESLMKKGQESFDEVGGKVIVMADSSWSSEEWLFFGVEEYPDIESEQNHTKKLNELNWFRYLESKVILGTEWEQS